MQGWFLNLITNNKSNKTFNIDENIKKPNGVLESPRALQVAVEILYKNRNITPIKYISKYVFASSKISCGVWSNFKIKLNYKSKNAKS